MGESAHSGEVEMSALDFQLCLDALDTLTSTEHSNLNYLFLEPVDTNYFPDYTTIVSRPMDLKSLRAYLQSGRYKSREEFFVDASLCFENAERYHTGRKETQWITKFAKDMARLLSKEKRKTERRALANAPHPMEKSDSKKSIKKGLDMKTEAPRSHPDMKEQVGEKKALKLNLFTGGNNSGTTSGISVKKSKKKKSSSSSDGGTSKKEEAKVPSSSEPPAPKRLSLKLKAPKSMSTDQTDMTITSSSNVISSKAEKNIPKEDREGENKGVVKTKPPKIKLKLSSDGSGESKGAVKAKAPKLKLKLSSTDGTGEGTKTKQPKIKLKLSPDGQGETKVAVKAKQPKIKLKLSLSSKLKTTVKDGKSPDKEGAASQVPAKPSPKVQPQSRGKVLPSGVQTNKSNPSVPASNQSRGKALPEGVVKDAVSTGETSTPKGRAPSPATKLKLNLSAPTSKIAPLPTPAPAKIKLSLSDPKKGTQAPAIVATQPLKALPLPVTTAPVRTTTVSSAPMNKIRKEACVKVITGLKRRQQKNSVWFLQPVNDPRLVADYSAKIPFPSDLGSLTSKLEKDQYTTVAAFVLDLRRVFGNCLRYNTGIKDSFRPVAIDMLSTTEELLNVFIAKPEVPALVYPPLLYCWKFCTGALDDLLNLVNPEDNLQTAHYFLHPVSFFCGGKFPGDYLEKVKRPIDLGTITSNLIEGNYQSVGTLVGDCRLVIENCFTFYGGRPDGALFTGQATRLQALMAQRLGSLVRMDQSPAAVEARKAALSLLSPSIVKPSKQFLLGLIEELRGIRYTDRFTKISEPAMIPFEKPVNLTFFPDYPQYVDTPMNLETVLKKVENSEYDTPEDFEYDINLIFRNCERYNVPKKNDHIILMAKHCAKSFRKLFSLRMKGGVKSYDVKSQDLTAKETKKRKTPEPDHAGSDVPKPTKKKVKTEQQLPSTKSGKATPRISITASTSAAKSTQRSKSPMNSESGGASKRRIQLTAPRANPNEPVPLHVAINQVKERYTIRRPYKALEGWEGACGRFFRELMRHPWISAGRPKFIFHAPVTALFPEVRDAYAAKIKTPMDLTTVEAKLLNGRIYVSPQDMVDDIALVFANAITFNKAGHDEGDPMSCAYFDASRHLLRYTRWLSLDHLSASLTNDSEFPETPSEDGQISKWTLNHANQKKAREEMENYVFKAYIDRGEEGDRYTLMETECEKLLKSLRHQSDLRYMTFFLQPLYPADYAAYIAKPRDWEYCQRKLQKREYDTFGEIIEDLRLIFSNALKYNARAKGTDTVSGRAYDSAIYMSTKLEVAIDKMLLSVSNRMEQEKIDHITAEREIEAAERLENERLRNEWKERSKSMGAADEDVKTRVETVETVRLIQRRAPQRKSITDFEFPFFEEDEGAGRHEQSHMEVIRQQKLIYEKQLQARIKMRNVTKAVGLNVLARLTECENARVWAQQMATQELSRKMVPMDEDDDATQRRDVFQYSPNDVNQLSLLGSTVATELNKPGRTQIKMAIHKNPKRRKKSRFPPLLLSEEE